ncbi:MAG: TetR/AcrR family transcriptional regulator [Allomuricauda sp.]
MSPRTEKQLAAHKEAKKEEIIKGALQLFANRGYFNTSINDIAKELKISKGFLYNYFSSKEVLLNAVVDFALKEASNLNIPEEELLDLSPVEMFQTVIEGYFALLIEKKELWRLITSLAIHVGSIPSVQKTISGVYETLTKDLETLFAMIGHKDPANEAIKLGAIMDGIGIQYLIFGESYPLEEIKKNILKTYITPSNPEQ